MTRPVTERDFRQQQYADAVVEDYEFREDGALVRKDRWDRWERGVHSIRNILEMPREFEIDDVVRSVKAQQDQLLRMARAIDDHATYPVSPDTGQDYVACRFCTGRFYGAGGEAHEGDCPAAVASQLLRGKDDE